MKTWMFRLAAWATIPLFALSSPGSEPAKATVYPVDTCLVTGNKFGGMGDPHVIRHEGREVRMCCAKCEPRFKRDPAKYLKVLDEVIIAQQKPRYPLQTCVVSGEPLGEEGDVIDLVHDNRLVRLCCEGCLEDFKANPKLFLGKLDGTHKPNAPAEPIQKHSPREHDEHNH